MGHDIIARKVNYDDNYVSDIIISGASSLYREFYTLMGVAEWIDTQGGIGSATYKNAELKHLWKIAHTVITEKSRRKYVKQFLRDCINAKDDISIDFI